MSRTAKQVIYGTFYAACWLAIFYGLYRLTLRPPASCFDVIQNRDEEQVDCGGQFCISCAIKNLKPIELNMPQLFAAADPEHANAILEIRNPNVAYGARAFDFDVAIYASGTTPLYTEHITTPVYPSELKYKLFINLPVAFSSDARLVATSTGVSWASITDLAKPRTPIREVRSVVSATSRRAVVTGILQNDNSFGLKRVTVNGLAIAANQTVVGVSKTVVQDVTPKEERFFQLTIPFFDPDVDPQTIEAKVTLEAERY